MENAIRQRIIEVFKKNKSNPTKFSGEDSAMQKRLSRQLKGGASITFETLSGILEAYPSVSAEWIMRGEGDMIKNSGVNIGDNNKVGDIANSASHINKNTVNVSLPESGDQKIIDPDGRVEISRADSSNELESLKREYELIKARCSHLEDSMKMKDDIIASQRDVIELLKHKL